MSSVHDQFIGAEPYYLPVANELEMTAAARLISHGIPVKQACYSALVSPVLDDASLLHAMHDLVDATFF